jgi:hypothetical protein
MSISRKVLRCFAIGLLVFTSRAFAQKNVVQPGDAIIASSSNSPGSEGVANAIDGTQAKYLNFDSANDAKVSGFVVTPSVGSTRVTGIAFESANDAPDRDPKSIILEGSNDETITNFNSGNWVGIYTNDAIPSWTATFPGGDRYKTQTFSFSNFSAFKHYRWTVVHTQGPSTCCMQIAEVQLLGSVLPGVVTQPGDPVIASSSNSPGSEGVANAIDGTQAKYLNFDSANDAKTSGFIVTPSIGATLVSGMTIESANDAPDRDVKAVLLEGSNDDSITNYTAGTWTGIYTNNSVTAWSVLFPGADRYKTQTFLFDNYVPFKHYRWTVLHTQGPSTCCMQVAEVGLLGTSAPQNILLPGDPIIASSSNSPGSEGVANAIDGTQAKYLNFDSANDAKTSGFVVTPSIGATVITGMAIESANDAPDRDVKAVSVEGSNDDNVTNFVSGNWEPVYVNNAVPSWTATFPGGDRYKTQTFYFPNQKSYKHYRWTVLHTQGPSTCCMQVAEVQLLAATQSNPCGQVAFLAPPVTTPVLAGSPATFQAIVNGPWSLQWLQNGKAIPGANKTTYTTPPVDANLATNVYSCAIVGCQTSAPVQAVIFTPSATKSLAVSFLGSGANGAPTAMDTVEIAGIQQQAYWNQATNASGATGDGTTMADSLLDSDGKASTVTFSFQTSGTWGSGVGTDSPTTRMLNGLVNANPGTPATFTFTGVPAGSHSVLLYVVSPPLVFQNVAYTVTGATSQTNYIRAMNSDEFKAAPGFYRGSSTDPKNPTVADFVRFDGVSPDSSGTITITADVTGSASRNTGLNGLQLVLNAPSPGAPPAISADPQPTVAPTNGVATLSVTATGNNLSYQWRKGGKNIPNTGAYSGANTATLTISPFSADAAGIYSVAVFNPAGSVISKNASVRVTKYNIQDALAGYWKFDETSGNTAANAATGGQAATVNGTAKWGSGQIIGSFSFDGATYLQVPSYTLATKQIAGSAWVNVSSAGSDDIIVYRNGQGALSAGSPGQFELRLVLNNNDGSLTPQASIGIGPNVAQVNAPSPLATGSWHHLAFSADGAQLRLYVDGVAVASTDYLADIGAPVVPYISIGALLNADTTVTPPVVGPDGTHPDYYLGSLDELALWDRALTADEVAAVYAAGTAGKTLSSVVITPPVAAKLNFSSSANGLVISWDASLTGYALQSADAVVNPTWTAVSGVANNSITVTPAGAAKFYRLFKP